MDTDCIIADKLFRMQLRDMRKARHLTQTEVSELSGLSKSCISNIESGEESSPTLASIIKYINAVGLELYAKPIEKKEIMCNIIIKG